MTNKAPTNRWRRTLAAFMADQSGATAIEYGVLATIAGLVAVGATDVLARAEPATGLASITDALSVGGQHTGGGHTFDR